MNDSRPIPESALEVTQEELCSTNNRLGHALLELEKSQALAKVNSAKVAELEVEIENLKEQNSHLNDKYQTDMQDRQELINSLQQTIWELNTRITSITHSKAYKLLEKLKRIFGKG